MENSKMYSCTKCSKSFTRPNTLKEHENSAHSGFRYRCPACSALFTHIRKLVPHFEAKHPNISDCSFCITEFKSPKDIISKNHLNSCLLVKPEPGQIFDPIEKPTPKILIPEDELIPADLSSYPKEQRDEVKAYWQLIRTSRNVTDLLDHAYNFRWAAVKGNFLDMLSDIFYNEKQSFKVDAAIGCILKNKETGMSKYWYACENNFSLLDKPELIQNGEDVKMVAQRLNSIDLEEKFCRPDTKWSLATITNIEFYVTPQKNFVAGCKDFLLPKRVAAQHNNILGMTQDSQRNKFNDNLCFFRCLAECLVGNFENKDFILECFFKYCSKKKIQAVVETFQGVPFTDLDMLEDLFQIDIQVFHIEDSGNAVSWRNAIRKYKFLLNLDICITGKGQAHYSYISNLNQYAKRYTCMLCNRMFKKMELYNDHARNHCHKGEIKHKFPGGVFQVKKSIFEQLEEFDIKIPTEHRFCPFLAVYDFESLLLKKQVKVSEKLTFINEHQPVSCAIHTNVHGFEPVCFVNQNPDILMQLVIDQLEIIAQKQGEILLNHYQEVFNLLDKKISHAKIYFEESKNRDKGYLNSLTKIKAIFYKYCTQLTCLGFNSGKYDINLIKSNLFPKLVGKARQETDKVWPKAILRNGSYLCLSTETLKFLDITAYVAPGFSLDSFMKAYGATLTKAKFPYEYLDDYSKLSETTLPPIEEFYSKLKNEAISLEDYAQCRKYWNELGMKCLGDYLVFYNKRDVIPFLEAVQNMAKLYWTQFNIDIFREALSLPGVTEKYLFKSINGTRFSLFSEHTKDLYYDLKASMTGGLSMVMTRLAIKDETFIRNNPNKPVKSIIGLDFNALYLWAQSKPTPTGYFDHWIAAKNEKFRKKSSSKPIAVEWLEQEAWKSGHFIQHQGNGSEKTIGVRNWLVDGYCEKTRTVYEFYGCFWHGHDCLNGVQNKELDSSELNAKRIEKENDIKRLGYNLVTIWECDWHTQRHEYLAKVGPHRKFMFINFVKKDDMISSILDGSVFGFAKVDISTPENLKEKYADFPPIIKHAEISREDIGDFMKQYAEKTDQLQKPRKALISSYFGKKIFLSTEMIRFLVNHGLELEKVYEIVQYDESTPFETFRDKVTQHRQEGDEDPELVMIADTFKLLGNTGYGKTLTNKENHMNVFYADYEKAAEASLSPYQKKIKCITNNCYEVHMRKQEIVLDLPIVVGLSVYNWAKIRMLQFFYDILQKYFDSADYQCMQTDTDSIYLALSAENLLHLVKPELRSEFEKVYLDWFVTSKATKRTPGLLKVEYQGTEMVCLAAKTYIATDNVTGQQKTSSKGLMKKLNNLSFQKYRQVLSNQKSVGGVNIGFRMQPDNKMWTYCQEKQGLPYLYIKRKVLPDGITTVPLDI